MLYCKSTFLMLYCSFFFYFLPVFVYIFAITVPISDNVLTVLNQQACALYLDQWVFFVLFCERQIWRQREDGDGLPTQTSQDKQKHWGI